MSAELRAEDLVLVHDYLIQMGGAERVVACMAAAYPASPIYTAAIESAGLLPEFQGRDIRTTWLQRLPGIQRNFKKVFPLYPAAFATLPLERRRAAWISSSTFAKCVRMPAGMASFLYCHSPTRFLWDTEIYVGSEVGNPAVRLLIRLLLPWLRRTDRAAARRMTAIVANSENVRDRIRDCYGRESSVIYPPVAVKRFSVSHEHGGYYLILSRLIAYKNVELAVRVFAKNGRQLRIIGTGTDRERLERLAEGRVQFLGRVDDAARQRELQGAKALIFPGEEDFGIAPVEAMACGKPVIALRKGGALETVIDNETGVFFETPTDAALSAAVERLESIDWHPQTIRRQAERFSEEHFLKNMRHFMEEHLAKGTAQ